MFRFQIHVALIPPSSVLLLSSLPHGVGGKRQDSMKGCNRAYEKFWEILSPLSLYLHY